MYQLALALGRANPDAMLAEMTPYHFREWQQFYNRHPWGEIRADTRSALLAIAIGHALGNAEAINVDSLFPYPRDGRDDIDEDSPENVWTVDELKQRYQGR